MDMYSWTYRQEYLGTCSLDNLCYILDVKLVLILYYCFGVRMAKLDYNSYPLRYVCLYIIDIGKK